MLRVQVIDNGAQAEIDRIAGKIARLRPLMDAIGAKLEQSAHLRFDTKTDPDGQAWRKWSPATAKARAQEGRGTLLEYTGLLRSSLGYTSGADWVEIGYDAPYADEVDGPGRGLLLSQSGDLGAVDAASVDALLAAYL
jgi:phage virion morphogenesis protein